MALAIRRDVWIGFGGVTFGALLGLALTMATSIWQEHRSAMNELHRAGKSVTSELANDLSILDKDISLLQQDNDLASKGRGIIETTDLLETSAGNTAYLNGSFEKDSMELEENVGAVYSAIEAFNRRLDARQTYVLTNSTVSNYFEMRSAINTVILSKAAELRPRIISLVDSIKARGLFRP